MTAHRTKQAHLQGTQSHRTKANLAKELALPTHGTHSKIRSDTDRGEARTYNMGFAKIRADGSYLRLFVILLCFISSLT